MGNKKLHKAKKAKNDEFYTQFSDIEKEMVHYREQFRNKVILCNCDDPMESNFVKYFALNFSSLELKKLISTHYKEDGSAYKLEVIEDINNGGELDLKNTIKVPLKESGDFRSKECIEILKEADIVVTNPPFSLFREYIAQLVEYDKKFIIVGHQNAIGYKESFKLIKDGKLWLGHGFKGGATHFINKYYENYAVAGDKKEGMIRVSGVVWFTNMEHQKRYEKIPLHKKYDKNIYPTYDNYEAINVDKTKDIPCDYYGDMGVPITFMTKFNPNQFEIVRFRKGVDGKDLVYTRNGVKKSPYSRIIIRRRD